jgi:hypothetical protein
VQPPELEPGEFEFKYVLTCTDGRVTWESGPNRKLKVFRNRLDLLEGKIEVPPWEGGTLTERNQEEGEESELEEVDQVMRVCMCMC